MIFFLLFFIKASTAQTNPITTFNELIESFKTGEPVKVAIHYNQYNWLDTSEQTPVSVGNAGMDIDKFEYFAPAVVRNKNAFVVFSMAWSILIPKGNGFFYN